MATLKELQEQRNQAAAEIRNLADQANDDKYKWTGEDEQKWKEVNADYDGLGEKIERAKRAEQVTAATEADQQAEEARQREAAAQRGVPGLDDYDGRGKDKPEHGRATPEDHALALQAWAREQAGMDLEERHVQAVQRTGFQTRAKELNIPLSQASYRDVRQMAAHGMRELRTTNYTSTTASQGGDVVPPGSLIRSLEIAMLAFGGVRQVADVMRTASGEPLEWPTTDDTSNEGELIGETDDSGDSAVADQNVATGNVTFNAYKYSSKLVRVTRELIEDEAVNFVDALGRLLGERIARKQNADFTTGNGSAKPNGIVSASTLGVTAASTTAITADELIDLLHSVDPSYRTGAGWMMADAIVQAIRKLKDSENNYLWQSGLRDGLPDTLLGFPITINQQMASTMEANAKVVLFGALNKYKIRDVASLRLRRLDERYAEFDQVGFVAFHRADGDLLDAGTNPVKYLANAAS